MGKKQLSFLGIFLLGINSIIGSGIFLLPGQIYHEMGLLSIVTILVAGLMAFIIALNYAVMAAKYNEDGGAWIYADNVFGSFTGFQVGWFGWWLGVITISAEVVALLTALMALVPALHNHTIFNATAIILLLVLGVINFFGPGLMEKVDNLATIAKLAIMIIFIVGGVWLIKGINLQLNLPGGMHSVGGFSDNFSTALSIIFYVFTGFNFLPIAAREMHNPQKTLPRALVLIMLTVTAIYVAVQFVAVGLLGNRIVHSDLPVADAFAVVFGPIGKAVILIGMCISILGVTIAGSFNTPIEMASLANEKQLLPKIYGKTNKFGSPWVANIITIAIACLLILSGGYIFLVKLIVLASFVQYVPTMLAVIKTRKNPNLPHDFELPGGYTFPIIGLLIVAYLLTGQSLLILFWGVGIFIMGTLIYLFDERRELLRHGKNK